MLKPILNFFMRSLILLCLILPILSHTYIKNTFANEEEVSPKEAFMKDATLVQTMPFKSVENGGYTSVISSDELFKKVRVLNGYKEEDEDLELMGIGGFNSQDGEIYFNGTDVFGIFATLEGNFQTHQMLKNFDVGFAQVGVFNPKYAKTIKIKKIQKEGGETMLRAISNAIAKETQGYSYLIKIKAQTTGLKVRTVNTFAKISKTEEVVKLKTAVNFETISRGGIVLIDKNKKFIATPDGASLNKKIEQEYLKKGYSMAEKFPHLVEFVKFKKPKKLIFTGILIGEDDAEAYLLKGLQLSSLYGKILDIDDLTNVEIRIHKIKNKVILGKN